MKRTNIEDTVRSILALDKQIEALEALRAEQEAALIKAVGVGGKVDTPEASVSVVVNTSITADVSVLAERVSRPVFKKLTKVVLNQAAFSAAYKAGLLPDAAREVAVVKETKPFLRITRKG